MALKFTVPNKHKPAPYGKVGKVGKEGKMANEFQLFNVEIAGKRMLMHNGQLADPLNEYAKALKEVTSKRKKSDADHEESARREFQGGLYFDEKAGPYIPDLVLVSMLVEGAKKRKLGKAFTATVSVVDEVNPLLYQGPRTRESLWNDRSFVDRRGAVVGTSRIMRTRPKFTDWSLRFQVSLLKSELNAADIEAALTDAGLYVGLGDHRPAFGKFMLRSFGPAKG